MERSLSIMLPVTNAEATMRGDVERLLEIASDLTEQFDMLILDNASTDQTPEIAAELSRLFPQIVFQRVAAPIDLSEVVRIGLSCTHGEIICLHEGAGAIRLADLRDLWQMRNDELLVLARKDGSSQAFEPGTVDRLLRGAGRVAAGSGFHLLRRDSIHRVQRGALLEIGHQRVHFRCDPPRSEKAIPAKRPNFLVRLRHFALGE